MTIALFSDLVLQFAIYSFLGWVCEVIYCSIPAKKLVQRGFLAGPYCPIYGFGAISLLLILYPLTQMKMSLPFIFIASVIITSALEYFTSWLMEKFFNMRWWDYSEHRFNLNGRICLLNSTLFGVLGIALLYLIQPIVLKLIYSVSLTTRIAISALFIAVMLVDLITTLNSVYKLDAKLKEIQQTLLNLRKYDERFTWYDKKDTETSLFHFKTIAKEFNDENINSLVKKLNKLLHKDRSGRRLLKSFSKLKSSTLQDNIEIVKQTFSEEKNKISKKLNKKVKQQNKKEEETNVKTKTKEKSFADGLNFYKLFWVFFLASFIGVIVEMLFCLVKNGYIESRQGMIYGPFNQVYGLGAVLMLLCLHKLEEKGDRWVFLGSAVIGGVFEAVCSLIQEYVFGSVSWDYSKLSFGLLGNRTNLLYMFFWGVLGVIFIKEIYPRLSRFVERIPNKQGVFLSWVLVIFLSLNILISAVAVYRWSERDQGIEAANSIETYLDEKYPDEFMSIIYPNMQFKHNE